MSQAPSRLKILAAAGGAALALATAALAQPAAPAATARTLTPADGEVRLVIDLAGREVAFPAKIAPAARQNVPFEAGGHAITEAGRAAVAQLQEALRRQPEGSLVLIVYGADEALAFRRARAIRGELAERHSMDAGRIVATARKAEAHAGDTVVADVFAVDPTRCGGCGGSTFRSIALDSAAVGLATATPETVAARAASGDQAAPSTAPAPRRAAPSAPVSAETAPARRPAPEGRARPEPPRAAAAQAAGCPRPRIIIDDYYPGGPIVPCRNGK